MSKLNDPVNHPTHYNSGRIEVIEAIEAWDLDFHLGNAVKYIARAGKKDSTKETEDLKKAIWYINRHIELIDAYSTGRDPIRPNEMNRKESEE